MIPAMPLRLQMSRRQLAHLAGADQHRRLVGEASRRSSAPGRPRPRRPTPPCRRCRSRCGRAWRPRRRGGTRGAAPTPRSRRAPPPRSAPSPGRGSAARRRPWSRGSTPRGRDGGPRRGRDACRGGARTRPARRRARCARNAGDRGRETVDLVVDAGDDLDAVARRDDRRLVHAVETRAAARAPASARPSGNPRRSRSATGAVRWLSPTMRMLRAMLSRTCRRACCRERARGRRGRTRARPRSR